MRNAQNRFSDSEHLFSFQAPSRHPARGKNRSPFDWRPLKYPLRKWELRQVAQGYVESRQDSAQRAEQGTRGIHAQLARGRYRAPGGSTGAWAESRFAGSPAKVGQWGKTSEKVKSGNGAVVFVVEIDPGLDPEPSVARNGPAGMAESS